MVLGHTCDACKEGSYDHDGDIYTECIPCPAGHVIAVCASLYYFTVFISLAYLHILLVVLNNMCLSVPYSFIRCYGTAKETAAWILPIVSKVHGSAINALASPVSWRVTVIHQQVPETTLTTN